MDNPADCAKKLIGGEVDLGLVPVAIIPLLEEAHIISESCIGANGSVETVCLFSEVPLSEVQEIILDYQSRTSVQLVKLLAEKFWNIKPRWTAAGKDFIGQIKGTTAGVVIGDRAFELRDSYPTIIDLSEEWKKHTDLPFVFACWVSNRQLPQSFINQFEEALKMGLNNRNEAVISMSTENHEMLVRYVNDVICYKLDEKKRQAMKLFLDWLSKPH